MLTGLRRIFEGVDSLKAVLERHSGTMPKTLKTRMIEEMKGISQHEPHTTAAHQWSHTYGPHLIRPGKKELQAMSSCRGGLLGTSREKCYPTWAYEATCWLTRDEDGGTIGLDLINIRPTNTKRSEL